MSTHSPTRPATLDPAQSDSTTAARVGRLLRNLAGIAVGLAGIALILYFDQRLRNDSSLPELGQNMSYGLLFTVGLLTGFHCVGMCGPLIIGYTAKGAAVGRPTYTSHLLYGTGKTLSYTLIGAAFGGLGSIISFTPLVRGVVGIAAGIFLMLFGLHMLHIWPALNRFQFKTPRFLTRFVGTQYKRHSNPFVIGLLNGLLIVCGPLQAMYVMAMGTGSPLEGGKLLFIFGLGTLPVLLSFGMLTSLISTRFTPKLLKASGVLVLLLGAVMLNRGLIVSGSGYDFNSLLRVASPQKALPEAADGLDASGTQVIRMDVTNQGFKPDHFTLKQGVPVRWVVDAHRSKLTTCQSKLIVVKLGLQLDIHEGVQTFEFTPREAGTIPWNCGMGMLTGYFTVMPAAGEAYATPTASEERIQEVAERGSHVMPFELQRTQHVFTKTRHGGVQRVLVRDPADSAQIALIREHLTKISTNFRRGDFSDPAKIHGESMPGLAALRSAKPGQLKIVYRDLPDGGEITYSSRSPALTKAVHAWFDAQLMDHGPDAVPGHPHDHMMHHGAPR